MLLDRIVQLREAQQHIEESSALIERQWQLIHELDRNGHDLTSARIVLDSMLLSHSLLEESAVRIREKIKAENLPAR
jgi:hypothetical protein